MSGVSRSPVCEEEADETDQKHDGQGAHAHVHAAGELDDGGYQGGSRKSGALAADVVDAEVFPGFVWGNDLGKIGAGQGLDGSLENTHTDGQDPELVLFF